MLKHPCAFLGDRVESVFVQANSTLPYVALVFAEGYLAYGVADPSLGRLVVGRGARGVVNHASIRVDPATTIETKLASRVTVRMRVGTAWISWSYMDTDYLDPGRNRPMVCAALVTSWSDPWPVFGWDDVTDSGLLRRETSTQEAARVSMRAVAFHVEHPEA